MASKPPNTWYLREVVLKQLLIKRRDFGLKLYTQVIYISIYISLNNTNLLIGHLYAGKMSLLYVQQYFLYDKIRKNAWKIMQMSQLAYKYILLHKTHLINWGCTFLACLLSKTTGMACCRTSLPPYLNKNNIHIQ